MKNDISIYEVKRLLKRFEKQNKIKTIIILGVGIALIAAVVIFVLSKAKKKTPVSYDGLDPEEFDDLDDLDYDDYDFDEEVFDDAIYDEEISEENE